jgi:hypothetical protein
VSAPADLARRLSAAHREALAVGDSPLRADRLADTLAPLADSLAGETLPEDTVARIRAALVTAERVLRRDDDGREAARHLQAALGLVEGRPRGPSPFPDD